MQVEVIDDRNYISVSHWGMFPMMCPPAPRQFVPYKAMPDLDDLRNRSMPPKSSLYA